MEDEESHEHEYEDIIGVSQGMSGHFAVLFTWTSLEGFPEGKFWEPQETGFGRYATREEAVEEALAWSASSGIRHAPFTASETDVV